MTWVLCRAQLHGVPVCKAREHRRYADSHTVLCAVIFQVQYVWFMLLYCAYMAVLLAIGSAVNIGFFRKNSYGLQIVSFTVPVPAVMVLHLMPKRSLVDIPQAAHPADVFSGCRARPATAQCLMLAVLPLTTGVLLRLGQLPRRLRVCHLHVFQGRQKCCGLRLHLHHRFRYVTLSAKQRLLSDRNRSWLHLSYFHPCSVKLP